MNCLTVLERDWTKNFERDWNKPQRHTVENFYLLSVDALASNHIKTE